MNALHLLLGLAIGVALVSACTYAGSKKAEGPVPGKDGNKYLPYDQRTGDEAAKATW